ncbi:MAG: tetratricopeptide repeat protein [Candidatus Sericytochromatia bacterium]
MKKIVIAFLSSLIFNLPSYAEKGIVIIPFESTNESKNLSYAISDNISQSLALSEDIYIINRGQLMSALKEKNLSIDLSKLNYVSSFFESDFTIKGKLLKSNNNSYQNSELYSLDIDLLDSKNGKIIKNIDIKSNDIFKLQEKAVKELLKTQKIYNTDEQLKNISNINYLTNDLKAYMLYLTAKNYSFIMTEESIKDAIEYLDKAIKLDSKFSLAKAEKAELKAILLLYSYFNEDVKTQDINRLSEYINKNLLDYSSIQLFRAKSIIYFLLKDYKNSLLEAKKAYEMSTGDSFTNYLIWLNDKDEVFLDKSLKYNNFFLPALISKSILEKNKENYESALEIYNKVNLFTPKQIMIDNLIADIYLEQKKRTKALKIYETNLYKEPNNYKVNIGLGKIYQEKDLNDKAVEYYKRAIEINKQNSLPHFLIAIIKHSEAKTEEAIEEYNNAINLEPENPKYYSGLGQLYYQLSKFDEAEIQYKKSIELKPEMAYAYVNLGLVYNKQKKKDDAIEKIKQAINIKPNYSYAFYNLGLIYQENGDNDNALDNYKKALILDDKSPLVYNKIGEIYQIMNNSYESINNFTKAIQLEPSFTLAYINLGKIQIYEKKFKEAISSFKTALKLKPKNKILRLEASNAYYEYGKDLFDKEIYKESITQFKEAINIKPDNENSYIYLGKAYFKISDFKSAINEFKRALFINSNNHETLYNLALSYEKLGLIKEYQLYLKKSCDLGGIQYCK